MAHSRAKRPAETRPRFAVVLVESVLYPTTSLHKLVFERKQGVGPHGMPVIASKYICSSLAQQKKR